jgi:hypothetical protein
MRTLLFAVAIAAGLSMQAEAVVTHNRLASNRLASNRLASNRLASNRLASNSLSSTKLSALAETADILRTKSGRQVYAYLMSCALAAGTRITKTDVYDCVDANDDGVPDDADHDGTPDDCSQLANDPAPTFEFDDPQFCDNGTCTFDGLVGLATDWANRRLSDAGQGWVSACMLARVNAFDTAEGISMRGPHPALSIATAERTNFTLEEGSFYGNIFAKNAIDWNACQGADQYDWLTSAVETPGDDAGGGLFTRDCAEASAANDGTTVCGFRYTGLCGNFANSDYSCKSQDALDGFYGDCHESDGAGKWGGQATYRQVITVYVSAPL